MTTTKPTAGTTASADTATLLRRITVAAPPAVLFALLSDPREHAALDGSGGVQGVIDAPERLVLGSEFRMQMKGYKTLNRVVEYRQDELIAWRHRGRHIWRWELRAVAGGTEVTETFDYRGKRCHAVVRMLGIPRRADVALAKTLAGLETRFA